ncbi:DNA primase [bacterium]|nr:MAG: DNA primase [bacterium]|tara:strand:- start:500 stop:2251 length:1752 start_codon:yes stop_codon:yes gene_type:complete
MPQIPQNTIDKIRDQADIVDVISREVELKRKGVNYFGICPFHDENTPSFSVSQSKQIYKCFGGCDAGGNVFTFIMEFYKLTFFESAKLLADRYNIILDISDNYSSSNEYSFLKAVHEDASLIFQQNLFSDIGKEPLQYLKKRNLTEQIIRKFRIGFAIDGWSGLINKIGPKYNNETSKLLKTGLFSRSEKGTVYDRFRSRIIFPISHQSGDVIAFGGRDYNKNDQAKYLNSPETAIYQKSNVLYGLNVTKSAITNSNNKYIILVEGYMDLLQLYQAGIEPVIAVSGTSLTKNHAAIIARYNKPVVILYDGDSAGGNAAIRAGFVLLQAGVEVYVVRPPGELDPDDWLLKDGREVLNDNIEKPSDFMEFHINYSNAKTFKGVQKSNYLHNVIGDIKNINDSIIKNELIKYLSEKLREKESDLIEILNQKRSYKKSETAVVKNSVFNFKTKLHRAELELIKILINSSFDKRKKLINNLGIDLFSHELLSKIMSKILTDESIENSKIIDYFSEKSERDFISGLLMEEKEIQNPDQIVKDCLSTIQSAPLKTRIDDLRLTIQQKEKNGADTSKELKEVMELQKKLYN